MAALVQATGSFLLSTGVSDFGVVAIFSLVGLTLSLVAAHFGFVAV
jgi:hypothetical protein